MSYSNGALADPRIERLDDDQRELQVAVAELKVTTQALSDKIEDTGRALHEKLDDLKTAFQQMATAERAGIDKLEAKLDPLVKRVDVIEGQLSLASKVMTFGSKKVLPLLLALGLGAGGAGALDALSKLLGG